jgi:hypothetical protein
VGSKISEKTIGINRSSRKVLCGRGLVLCIISRYGNPGELLAGVMSPRALEFGSFLTDKIDLSADINGLT